MSNILILGGSFIQSNFVNRAILDGHNILVVDRDSECYCNKNYPNLNFVQCDFSNYSRVRNIFNDNHFDFAYSPSTEIGNLICANLSKEFGFLYNDISVVNNTLNKSLMKKCLVKSKNVKNIPDYDIKKLKRNMWSFPVIVKPVDSSGGRGVSIVNQEGELGDAIKFAQNYSRNPPIVEKYVKGVQLSIETVTFNGQHSIVAVTSEFIVGETSRVERSHEISKNIHDKYFNLIQQSIQEILDIFKIKVGPSHIEIIVIEDTNEIYLIEIASRAGAFRDELIDISVGVHFNELIIKSYQGREKADDFYVPKKSAMVNLLQSESDIDFVSSLERSDKHEKTVILKPVLDKAAIDMTEVIGYSYFSGNGRLDDCNLAKCLKLDRYKINDIGAKI